MYGKIKTYMEKFHMLDDVDTLVVGVSGGADSVCLFRVLLELKKEQSFDLAAVHVNHGLRKEAADRDQEYVQALCDRAGVPLFVFRKNVAQFAKEHGLSEEEAGRVVRRESFEQVAREYPKARIALAHHMDDNAETLLMNMARGTGLRGMAGIKPVAGSYIRPLLCVRRREIEAYLAQQQISFCTDATNQEECYTRNRIRKSVLPVLEEQVNDKAVEHLWELASQMEHLGNYIERQVDQAWEKCVTEEPESVRIAIPAFLEVDPELRGTLIQRGLWKISGKEKDIEAVHCSMVEKLCRKQSGKMVSLPYGMIAIRRYDEICIEMENIDNDIEDPILKQYEIRTRILECDNIPESFQQQTYTKWFDYDIIKGTVNLRTRRAGDSIVIDREGHRQSLKKYFINNKIPENVRNRIPLVADETDVLWIVGHRQSKKYQVTENTKRILEIQIHYGGRENGRNS